MCTIKFMKDGHPERIHSDYCLSEEEAKEQAARKLQREQELQSKEAAISKCVSETSKTPHKDELDLYIKQRKFPGKVKYDTRACGGGYQSTVFVPRSGRFCGEVCRSEQQAEENAACQALRTLGRI